MTSCETEADKGGPKDCMTPYSPLDLYYPSLPSSPDSESPGTLSEVSFPGLADMRSGAGITNTGEVTLSDPSKEERKLQVNLRSDLPPRI